MLTTEGWTPAVCERLCPVTKLWPLLMNKKALVHRLPFPHSLKPQGGSSAADLVTLTGLSSATSLSGTLTRQSPQRLEGPCMIVEASVKALRTQACGQRCPVFSLRPQQWGWERSATSGPCTSWGAGPPPHTACRAGSPGLRPEWLLLLEAKINCTV